MTTITPIKHHRGFSLLEVLVAFSIATLSLGVIFQIYAKGTRSAILGEEYAQAILIAESKLASSGTAENLSSANKNGRENKYDWEILIEDFVDEELTSLASSLTLKQVSVSVSWSSGGKLRSISLQSLKPMPTT